MPVFSHVKFVFTYLYWNNTNQVKYRVIPWLPYLCDIMHINNYVLIYLNGNGPVYCKSMAHNICKYELGDILKCSCRFLLADRVYCGADRMCLQLVFEAPHGTRAYEWLRVGANVTFPPSHTIHWKQLVDSDSAKVHQPASMMFIYIHGCIYGAYVDVYHSTCISVFVSLTNCICIICLF